MLCRIIFRNTLKKKCRAFPCCLINLGVFFFRPLGLVLFIIDFWSFIKRSDWLCISFSCGILLALILLLLLLSRFLFTFPDINTREALENLKVYKLSQMFTFKLCEHVRYFPSHLYGWLSFTVKSHSQEPCVFKLA